MGWCRCSYRTCTMRTDGVTHMFHYPVFDKARCHQWLMNANRTEFLDLKISQLKNRVVCQHHFKDECFMNYKKDKLTKSAVPTENGPYCAPQDYLDDSKMILPVKKLDTEQLTYPQKVASFKVKYRDFLVNYDTLDLDCQALQLSLEENKTKEPQERPKLFASTPKVPKTKSPKVKNVHEIKQTPQEVEPVHQTPILNSGMENVNPNNNNSELITLYDLIQNKNSQQQISNNISAAKESSVKILKVENVSFLSAPNVSAPGTVVRQDQFPYELCLIDNPPPQASIELFDSRVSNVLPDQNANQYIVPQIVNPETTSETQPEVQEMSLLKPHNSNNFSSVQRSDQAQVKTNILSKTIKVKLSPEEYSKIEEKRRLNRTKINDMMKDGLEQLDGQNKKPLINSKVTEKSILRNNKTRVSKKNVDDIISEVKAGSTLEKTVKEKNSDTEMVGQFLSKESTLPTLNEYSVASLTNKLQRMEELLLNKIDQNARRINELKNIVEPKPGVIKKHSVFTQTSMEDYKRFLFEEISVFVNSETKSQIYEELFINKHSINKPHRQSPVKSPQAAKRRRR